MGAVGAQLSAPFPGGTLFGLTVPKAAIVVSSIVKMAALPSRAPVETRPVMPKAIAVKLLIFLAGNSFVDAVRTNACGNCSEGSVNGIIGCLSLYGDEKPRCVWSVTVRPCVVFHHLVFWVRGD